MNPCFHVKAKPYSSFVAFVRYKNDQPNIMWINPLDPHGSFGDGFGDVGLNPTLALVDEDFSTRRR